MEKNWLYEGGLKSSYVVYDFFDSWDPSIGAPIKEVCGLLGVLCLKIDLFWLHSIRVSLSAYEDFSWSSYNRILNQFINTIFSVLCI